MLATHLVDVGLVIVGAVWLVSLAIGIIGLFLVGRRR